MKKSLTIFSLWFFLWPFAQRLEAQNGDAREIFAQAYSLYSNRNPSQAKELFQKTLDANYRLADYSLYYLAVIAFNESDLAQSRQYLSQLKQLYPQTVWLHAAALQRAKLDIAETKYSQANETLRQLLADKSVKREILDEALYLRAQAWESQGDLNRAYSSYEELRGASPNSRWPGLARKEQNRLREKYPEQFALSTISALSD